LGLYNTGTQERADVMASLEAAFRRCEDVDSFVPRAVIVTTARYPADGIPVR